MHVIALTVIAAVWLVAWRTGLRWCRGCGVAERASVWALACVLPTAGLIVSVHLIALISLFFGRALLTPALVAIVFIFLTSLARRWSVRFSEEAGAGESEPPTSAAPPRLGCWWLPILVVVGMYAVFLGDAVTRYPTGWDGLHYHLLLAVEWARDHAMNLAPGVIHQSFPENGMIVPCLLAFAKLERLLTIVHLPKALLLAAVIFGLVRAVGAGRRGAIAGTCVALSVPIVVFQSFSSYIDLYAAVSWLSALLALVWATRVSTDVQRRGLLIMAGLSAGVALGSKTTYLVLVAMLGIVAVAVEWIRPLNFRRDVRRPARNAVVFGVAALACSAFWFVRGTVQAGNPVYPLAVEIGGRQILPGYTAHEAFTDRGLASRIQRWWDYPWHETRKSGWRGYPYGTGNALGAAYATFVPLGLLAALCSAMRRRRRSVMHDWRFIYTVLVLSGIAILLTIFHEMLRFVLPLVLLAVPVAAVLVDRLVIRAERLTLALLTLSLGVTAAIATLQPAHAFLGRVKSQAWQRAAFYEVPELVDRFEPGTRVLNLASPTLSYALLGRALGNEVVTLEEWGVLLGEDTISTRTLGDNRIDYVYARHPWPRDWPDELPVKLIYDDTDTRRLATTAPTRVYRVTAAPVRSDEAPVPVCRDRWHAYLNGEGR